MPLYNPSITKWIDKQINLFPYDIHYVYQTYEDNKEFQLQEMEEWTNSNYSSTEEKKNPEMSNLLWQKLWERNICSHKWTRNFISNDGSHK